MSLPAPERLQFEARIDGWVREALDRGANDLSSLLRDLPGVFPIAAVESLGRIVTPSRQASFLSASGRETEEPSKVPSCLARLRPPHPLDYEWRFSYRASVALIDLALSLNQNASALACFGAPTVGIASLEDRRFRNTLVVDSNRGVLNEIRASYANAVIIEMDLLAASALALPTFDVGVLDPPWYPEYFESFLLSCAAAIVPGGSILMVVPMEGTRPGMERERADLEEMVHALGGEVQRKLVRFLEYETPMFEQNALRAAGLSTPLKAWRRADVWCISMPNGPVVARSRPLPTQELSRWVSHIVEGHDLRVRNPGLEGPDFERLSLRSVVEGDILATVSRRAPIRERVHLWTCGNRVFATDNLAALDATLAIASGVGLSVEAVTRALGDRLSAAAHFNVSKVIERLQQVVDSEQRLGEQCIDEGSYAEALSPAQ
jgi:hypothetical protein